MNWKPKMSEGDFAKNLRGFLAELDEVDEELEKLRERRKEIKRRAKGIGVKVKYLIAVHDLTKIDAEKRDLSDTILAFYRKHAGIEVRHDLVDQAEDEAA